MVLPIVSALLLQPGDGGEPGPIGGGGGSPPSMPPIVLPIDGPSSVSAILAVILVLLLLATVGSIGLNLARRVHERILRNRG